MGARQKAQKRGKAAKGSQKGTPASQKKLNSSMHVPDLSSSTRAEALMGWRDFSLSSSPSNRKPFTMGDAARNTERHTLGWGSSKLRDQGISFVNAGTLHQDPEHIKAQGDGRKESQDSQLEPESEPEPDPGNSKQESSTQHANGDTAPALAPTPSLSHKSVKVEDKEDENGQAASAVAKSIPIRPRTRSASPVSSSDSEQIVFRGRSEGAVGSNKPEKSSKNTSRPISPIKPGSAEGNVRSTAETVEQSDVSKFVNIVQDEKRTSEFEASTNGGRSRRYGSRRRGRGGRRRQSDIDEEEALMRDYIANMIMDDSEESEEKHHPESIIQQPRPTKVRKNETFRYYEGSGEENMKVQLQPINTPPPKKNVRQAIDWESDDLQDFDDLSTTDEEVDEISQVLRHRLRSSGRQYLVTPGGLGTSDAKWILHAKLVSESARKEIAIFEEIQAMEFAEGSLSDDDENDDDDDDEDDDESTDEEAEEALNDLIDHIESEDDENARIMKHMAKMSDEQIARALAKQEELGMGGDELMIFSGDIDEEDEEEKIDMDDAFRRNDDFVSFSIKQHTSNRTRSNRNKKNRDSFPSAAAFADALDQDPYGGFDVMDFDRPSLRPKKKGRKSDFPYDLELDDEDLRDQLVSTWTKDREKKVTRKRQKEEERQATLLEYADRSEPAAIKAEIRRFLLQEVDTLRLSPMESAVRASVHRLAKALKLNSRSEGKEGVGKGRYPVLTKTIRTPSYTIDTVWEVDALLNTRKFFPKSSFRRDNLPRGTARAMRVRQSGGVHGASYMNGEVVGASAPEIGIENKGRAMLEKMGWSSGMAIGAEGNKGSLEAVKHVFKTSRAGLG